MYSKSFKQKAIKMYKSGMHLRDVANEIGASPASISRWLKECSIKPNNQWRSKRPIEKRFWKKVNKNTRKHSQHAAGQCWEWAAFRTPAGYGRFWDGEKYDYAHRFSWLLHSDKEEIPKGLDIMHICDNPSCVRPSHLTIGTRSENILDSVEKGRWGGKKR